ncbi:toll/interleukin-1 receptor domain-containing protein [Parvularcula flava]|uniref:Toll/interleukin-1 receptor domain-containing protein n=1 Tax=Aquisalinus luteolus TaxID=1566827 RepID=A0A8J3ERC2_9PROT|nr:toll/interleukin-1 receptor domain-containing protein [Aquisalinus luteolus]NHK28526.1 toll/interleukin-1 receptor domain-containing protein [Aquisalinus luteolus]GGH98742.1 hypothetical protein GCM10011355_23050 [Aquisalinus luteolus]
MSNSGQYVFVSYFREDKGKVRSILNHLEANSIPYWVDEKGMEGGEAWEAKIRQRIYGASAFLLVLSKSYYKRPNSYVHKEIAIAKEKAASQHPSIRWIVPALLEKMLIPDLTISGQQKLSDLHVITSGWSREKFHTEISNTLKQIIEDSNVNSAKITVYNHDISKNIHIFKSKTKTYMPSGRLEDEKPTGYLILMNGGVWEDLSEQHFTFGGIEGAVTIPMRSRVQASIPAGTFHLFVGRGFFIGEDPEGRFTSSDVLETSEGVTFTASAGDQVNFTVVKSKKFLGIFNAPGWSPYTLAKTSSD